MKHLNISIHNKSYIGIWFLLGIFILSISSCKFQEPRLSGAKTFEITDGPTGKKAIKFDIRIENPNSIGFKLKNPAFEVFMNDKKIGSAYTENTVKVKAKSNDYHSIFAQSDINSFSNLVDMAGSLLKTGGIKLTLRGNMRVKVLFIGKDLKFEESKTFSIKEFLKL